MCRYTSRIWKRFFRDTLKWQPKSRIWILTCKCWSTRTTTSLSVPRMQLNGNFFQFLKSLVNNCHCQYPFNVGRMDRVYQHYIFPWRFCCSFLFQQVFWCRSNYCLFEQFIQIGSLKFLHKCCLRTLMCRYWNFAFHRMKSNIVGMEANMEQLLDKVCLNIFMSALIEFFEQCTEKKWGKEITAKHIFSSFIIADSVSAI